MAPKKPKEINKKDTEEVWKFLLTQVRSETIGRKGRVARKRIDPFSTSLWRVYIRRKQRRKTPELYIENFRHYSHRLEEVDRSLEEKVDLYYALELKVPESLRETFVEKFKVSINEEGIITGSPEMDHWDDTHPDSDTEEKRKRNHKIGRPQHRFVEKEDGDMWNFMLEKVNNGEDVLENKTQVWREFQRDRGSTRSLTVLANRFAFFLLPNLHRMPFDIETMAALYQTLQATVPQSFREKLTSATGVILADDGTVVSYENRPEPLVLQSNPRASRYGIESETRTSLLKNFCKPTLDNIPFTKAEEQAMWDFVVRFVRNKEGRVVKRYNKVNGYIIWKAFLKENHWDRTWQSLALHFSDNLSDNIMDADIDMLNKIEIYFVLSKPVSEEVLEAFRTEAHVELKKNRTIGYAGAGPFWKLGHPHFRWAKKERKVYMGQESDASDQSDEEEEAEEEEDFLYDYDWMNESSDDEQEFKLPPSEDSTPSTSSALHANRIPLPPQVFQKGGLTFEELERRRAEHIRILKNEKWRKVVPEPQPESSAPENSVRFPYVGKTARKKARGRNSAKKTELELKREKDMKSEETVEEIGEFEAKNVKKDTPVEHLPTEQLYLSEAGGFVKKHVRAVKRKSGPSENQQIGYANTPGPSNAQKAGNSRKKPVPEPQPKRRKCMNDVFKELEEELRDFCQRLKTNAMFLSDEDRRQCVIRLENMTRMFHYHTKRYLT